MLAAWLQMADRLAANHGIRSDCLPFEEQRWTETNSSTKLFSWRPRRGDSGAAVPLPRVLVKDGEIIATRSNHVTSLLIPRLMPRLYAIRSLLPGAYGTSTWPDVRFTVAVSRVQVPGAIYWSRPHTCSSAAHRTLAAGNLVFDDFLHQGQYACPFFTTGVCLIEQLVPASIGGPLGEGMATKWPR